MNIDLAEDSRQRTADVAALMVLAQHSLRNVDPDFLRLASMVSTYCAGESPEALRRYGAMDWEKAIRAMKIAFAKHSLATQQAGPDELPSPQMDEHIGKCLLAAFLKFMTFRSINPDWYAAHLHDMQLVEAVPGR